MLNNAKNQKEESRANLLRQLWLPKESRSIVLSYIQDREIALFMQSACDSIWVTLITSIDALALVGADIWITDILFDTIPIATLAQNRVVAVIPTSQSKVFSEFDPMKFEWNAFIFESVNQFQMFEKLIRALENMRYAGDKRMLLANVEKTHIW